MNRLFAANTEFDLKSGNVTMALRRNNEIDNKIKLILQTARLVHPLDFYEIDQTLRESEILDNLATEENLEEYLDREFKTDYLIRLVQRKVRENHINNLSNDEIQQQINLLKGVVNNMTEAVIYEYSRSNELSGDLNSESRRNKRNYMKYHRQTIPLDEVRGVNDKILDLQNYEQHRIKDILNKQGDYAKQGTIFDKKLEEILDGMINFIINIPEKYDKYYSSLDNPNILLKHLSSIVLVILDKDNSIYIGLYLLIISIILYSINIIQV